MAYNKNKLHWTLDYRFRDTLNFDFSEKGLGIVSPPHFVYDFSRKMFLMSSSINWPNFITWLLLLLRILVNMLLQLFANQVVTLNFEINLNFLIKPFFAWRKSEDKLYVSWEREELLRWNKKHFSSFWNSFQMPKIASDLRVHL